jgi:hypothetical protein
MFFKKNKYASSWSTVNVNGKTIRVHGSNISIINGKIIVDGKPIQEALDEPNITVIVEGDCQTLSTYGNVEVRGSVGNVDCRGSCHVEGNVTGNIDASGSVTCGDVSGDIDAHGSVRCIRR